MNIFQTRLIPRWKLLLMMICSATPVVYMFLMNKTYLVNIHVPSEKGSDLTTIGVVPGVGVVPPFERGEMKLDIDFNINRVFTYRNKRRNYADKIQSKRLKIPKILHLMWKDEIIPSEFVGNVKSFHEKNPEWEIYFWTDKSGRQFIYDTQPFLLQTFDNYKVNVSKADALRIIVMYYFGGAYFDIDTVCLQSLDALAETEQCIMGPEPFESTALFVQEQSMLSSSAFMCIPKHGLFHFLIGKLPLTRDNRDILQVAGPMFVTKYFNEYMESKNYQYLLDNEYESFHVIDYDVLEGNTLNYQRQESLLLKCKSRRFRESTSFINKACRNIQSKTFIQNNTNPKLVVKHIHFNTYNKKRNGNIHFARENTIRNIIPQVKIYPDL